ncbi:uncharacterized protein J3R85_007355 [Psidium guajava]|nr:uncharacterized protein J3R85_007355 [Psidium guajava]
MDPDPRSYPLLAFALYQIDPNSHRHLPPDVARNLYDQMPPLTNPKVASSLAQSVPANILQTRTLLHALGPRPDPSAVAAARAKIAQLEAGDGAAEANRSEIGIYKAVVRLEEMHEEYEKQLRGAEEKLAEVYGRVVEEEAGLVDEEVVRVLREVEENRAVERVVLSGRQLRFVPEALGKISGLLVLDLSHNLLEVIPDSIGGLKSLELLDISSNLLESLPDSIGLLVNLKVLNVSGNKLKALPESIAGCSSLKELDASFNNLTFLPTNIGYGLTNLEKLSISLNKLCMLPQSICEMKSLRYLDAHFNELRGVPHAIGRLAYLEVLNLSSNFNDLTELPDTIGDLTNLRELDLSNNQIRALPDSFYRLENLIKLNLDENPLVVPPLEIAKKGAEAVREFMRKRWQDMLAEEQLRRIRQASQPQAQAGWLAWGGSLLSGLASGVSRSVASYLGGEKAPRDPYLDQQL